MMPATPITTHIASNGSRAVLPVSNATAVLGTCSSGVVGQLISIGSTAALVEELGSGPLVQLAALYLQVTGRPVYCMRVNSSVASTMSSVTAMRIGTSTGVITNSGSTPTDAYDVIIEILSTGAIGAATYRYSLDGGDSYSGTLVTGATITLGLSGITLGLSAGSGTAFEEGDLFFFTTTAPGFGASDLDAALSAFLSTSTRVRRIHVTSISVSSAILYPTIRAAMTAAQSSYRYLYTILESDDRTGSESVTAWQSGVLADFETDNERTQVIAGWHEVQMVLPVGSDHLLLRRPAAWVVGPRQAAIDVSEDAGAVVDGPLSSAVLSAKTASSPSGLDIDGRLYPTFEGRGITTVQTYLGRTGIYCGGAYMRVSSTNDFYRVAHRQVMDVACETLYDILLDYINTTVGANADGTILESEAQSIEARLNAAIESTLVTVTPQRISPAADGQYARVDRTTNIVATEQLQVTVGLTPRAFVGSAALHIGFTIAVPVSA